MSQRLMNQLVKKKTKPRGKGKSINYHLSVLGADRYIPDVYINKAVSSNKKKNINVTTIYERHEKYMISWAAVKAFRASVKDARTDRELRKLIESYHAIKRILSHRV